MASRTSRVPSSAASEDDVLVVGQRHIAVSDADDPLPGLANRDDLDVPDPSEPALCLPLCPAP
jgi:hypothetical protein